MEKIKVLFIDNFDSFTYNLVDEFGKRDCPTRVYRADTSLDELKKIADEFGPDLLVLSPGPGLCIGSIRKRNSAERRHGRHGGDGCGWKKAWASIGKGHNRRSGVRVLRAI